MDIGHLSKLMYVRYLNIIIQLCISMLQLMRYIHIHFLQREALVTFRFMDYKHVSIKIVSLRPKSLLHVYVFDWTHELFTLCVKGLRPQIKQ